MDDCNFNDEPLYVVTSVFNPRRFSSRYRLYKQFEHHMKCSGATLYTVEVAFGERPFEVTQKDNPQHIQLRSGQEIWLKENAINVGFSRLPLSWKYACWLDADISFMRSDWVSESKHVLQHSPVAQVFSRVHDLGPDHSIYQSFNGFAYSYRNGIPDSRTLKDRRKGYGSIWHSGFGTLFTKKCFNDLGGLPDFGILGSGDYHQWTGLVGNIERSFPKNASPGYKEWCKIWEARAVEYVKGNVGYVQGDIFHHFHGKKKDRRYADRWQILLSENFDPEFDLKRDWQGLWSLTDRSPKLRTAIQDYFRFRNEDSIDL